MFSDNDRISIRQVFRLFVFDFIGGSTLVLPARLCGLAGGGGLFSIVLGGGIASLYLLYLGMVVSRIDTDFLIFMQQSLPRWLTKGILFLLLVHCILVAGYAAYIFADVMKLGLVAGEHYSLILVLLLLVAAYAVYGGVESRARVYEVLFWIIFIPLFLMLILAARDVEPENMAPFFTARLPEVGKGSMLVLFCLMPVFLALFFPAYVEKKKRGKMLSAVLAALWFALGVMAVLYVILLGNFGSASLAAMEYPAVTLMSSIELRGSFLKRFDAFMIGIWFFTLFALVNVFLFYGKVFMQKLFACRNRKSQAFSFGAVLVVVYVFAMLFGRPGNEEIFTAYMRDLAMPFVVLLPIAVLGWGKASGPKDRVPAGKVLNHGKEREKEQ